MDKQQVEQFFLAYSRRFDLSLAGEPDTDGTIQSFADCFVESSPVGLVCGKNDAAFREAIPQGYDFYRSIGTRSMTIDRLEVTLLDELHAMARAHWAAVYDKGGKELVIEFEVIYFVRDQGGALKIFAYITGDEQGVLKKHGLLPG